MTDIILKNQDGCLEMLKEIDGIQDAMKKKFFSNHQNANEDDIDNASNDEIVELVFTELKEREEKLKDFSSKIVVDKEYETLYNQRKEGLQKITTEKLKDRSNKEKAVQIYGFLLERLEEDQGKDMMESFINTTMHLIILIPLIADLLTE